MIGKCQMERHEPVPAVQSLKVALDAILFYKKEGDEMYKRLLVQEKEMRRLYAECMQKIKADKEKEKQRARAMFGGPEEKKDAEKRIPQQNQRSASSSGTSSENSAESISPRSVVADPVAEHPKKRVSFADGSSPGEEDDSGPSFFEEHMEAIILVAGIGLGCWLTSMALRRR